MTAVWDNDVDTGTRAHPFARFTGEQTVLLTSYRRDGTPVGTPVSIYVADDGERAYFRTWDAAWKTKRIRRNPEVTIAPSTFRGQPTGPAIRARARQLSGAEADRAAQGLSSKHPLLHRWLVPLIHRLRGNETVHFELTAVE